MTIEELMAKLHRIKDMGFVKTHRIHDTGIGKTLEDLLEINENNIRLPDLGEFELKAKRVNSSSMLTLATKSPLPKGINRILFERYKYLDSEGQFNLHSTVYGSRFNPQGFKLSLQDNKLCLNNRDNIEAYWFLSDIFEDVLKSKSNKILLVFAECKGSPRSANEEFHYVEAHLLSDLNIHKLSNAIENDKLKVDIRIGVFRSGRNMGRFHDHGTAFRVMKRDFLEIFGSYMKLI